MQKLKDLVASLPEETRASAQADINAVFRAGIRSETDLANVLSDQEKESKLRCQACWLLSRVGGRSTDSTLARRLNDLNPQVRAEAARGLGVRGANAWISELISTLESDPEVEVKRSAAYALGLIGDRRSLEALVLKVGDRRAHSGLRGVAAEALADIADRGAVVPLIEALSDVSAEVRLWAAFALGRLGDAEALPELQRLQTSDHREVPGHGRVSDEAREAIIRIQEHQEKYGI